MPILQMLSGPQKGTHVDLTGDRFVIGRAQECELVLDIPLASRHHACFYKGDSGWRVQDLGSVNGTLLNGERVEEADVTSGDRVSIGEVDMIFENPDAVSESETETEETVEEEGEEETVVVAAVPGQGPARAAAKSGAVAAASPVIEEEVPAQQEEEQVVVPPPAPAPASAHAHPPERIATSDAAVQAMVRQMSLKTKAIAKEISKAIIGQSDIITQLLTAIISNGHVLMIGMPGLAKTTMIRTLADVLDMQFRRIQFTPDLMPSDITGTDVLEVDEHTGKKEYRFIHGPIFTNILLADEINRTPPKTQAALLEAMQEHRVTAAGQTYKLKPPFFVLATQNPLEQEGTYPLPEAQLDRFMFSVWVDYPTEEDEETIAAVTTRKSTVELAKVLTGPEIIELQEVVREMPISQHVVKYATRLARSTRPADQRAPDFVKKWLHCGSGPRASQYLVVAAKARAVTQGRLLVTTDDVRAIARPVLRHRIFTNFAADAEGMDTDKIVQKLIESVEEPSEKDYK